MDRNLSKVNYENIIVSLNYNFDGNDYEKDVNVIHDDVDDYFKIALPSELFNFLDLQALSEDEHFIKFLHEKLAEDIRELYEEDRASETAELEGEVQTEVDNHPQNYVNYTKEDVEKLLDQVAKENYLTLADKEELVDSVLDYISHIDLSDK